MPTFTNLFGGGSTKIDCRKKGTLILTYLLEDLDVNPLKGVGFEASSWLSGFLPRKVRHIWTQPLNAFARKKQTPTEE